MKTHKIISLTLTLLLAMGMGQFASARTVTIATVGNFPKADVDSNETQAGNAVLLSFLINNQILGRIEQPGTGLTLRNFPNNQTKILMIARKMVGRQVMPDGGSQISLGDFDADITIPQGKGNLTIALEEQGQNIVADVNGTKQILVFK